MAFAAQRPAPWDRLMDTAAFIVTLLVFVSVGFWYVENEMKKSDGAHGLFAVRQTEKPRKARVARYADGADAMRYRPRAKPEPGLQSPASSAIADSAKGGASPEEPPKYRRKERAWDRAVKLEDED